MNLNGLKGHQPMVITLRLWLRFDGSDGAHLNGYMILIRID
jgi:hypothetical protein